MTVLLAFRLWVTQRSHTHSCAMHILACVGFEDAALIGAGESLAVIAISRGAPTYLAAQNASGV